MTKRGGRVGVGVAIALAIAVPAAAQTGQPAASFKAPVISDTGRLKGPRQPIFFRHDVHAGQDHVPCLYCHSTVTISSGTATASGRVSRARNSGSGATR